MSQALLHPKKKVPKTYIAKIKGELSLKNLSVRLGAPSLVAARHRLREADARVRVAPQ